MYVCMYVCMYVGRYVGTYVRNKRKSFHPFTSSFFSQPCNQGFVCHFQISMISYRCITWFSEQILIIPLFPSGFSKSTRNWFLHPEIPDCLIQVANASWLAHAKHPQKKTIRGDPMIFPVVFFWSEFLGVVGGPQVVISFYQFVFLLLVAGALRWLFVVFLQFFACGGPVSPLIIRSIQNHHLVHLLITVASVHAKYVTFSQCSLPPWINSQKCLA